MAPHKNYAWMESLAMTASYLDSPNAQFCCLWRQGMLLSVALLVSILTIEYKSIRFLKFSSKFSNHSTVSREIFAMKLSSRGKFDL